MHGASNIILTPNTGAVLPVILQYPDFHATTPGERVTGVTYNLLTVRYSILSGHCRGGVNQNAWITKTMKPNFIALQLADSGSRTTIVDSALTQIEDYWNGALLSLYAGEGDFHRVVNDFVAATDTLHFDPLHFEVAAGDEYNLEFWHENGHGVYILPFSKDELGTNGLLVYHVELTADATVFYTGFAQIDESLCLIKMKS